MNRRQKGISIFELLSVIALIGLVFSTSSLSYSHVRKRIIFQQEIESIVRDLTFYQREALQSGQIVTLEFQPGLIVIGKENKLQKEKALIRTIKLSQELRVIKALFGNNAQGTHKNILYLYPSGVLSPGTVEFKSSYGRYCTVTLSLRGASRLFCENS